MGNMNILTRKNGIWLFVIGIAMFLLNYFTLTWWDIDIDILGVMIAVLGLVIAIASGNKMKRSKKWLTRKNGVWLCVIGVAIEIIVGLLNLLGLSNSGGGFGAIVFVLGIILTAVRWKH
jgi:drug/metabolite transporter (DMT)-like permease